jgi:excisionase family DNA binding protein
MEAHEQGPAALLMTAPEVAKALAVSESTLARLVAAGRIPVIPVGKRGIRFDPADLRAFVAREKTSARVPCA